MAVHKRKSARKKQVARKMARKKKVPGLKKAAKKAAARKKVARKAPARKKETRGKTSAAREPAKARTRTTSKLGNKSSGSDLVYSDIRRTMHSSILKRLI
jgi:hypothetical protein